MSKIQRNCLTATLLMGMMFLAAIFTLQGALLTSLIAHYSVADSIQGFASSAASVGGVVALVSSFFPIGKLPNFCCSDWLWQPAQCSWHF